MPYMQNSIKILIFSNCACVKPFQHKSELGNILTLKTRNFFFEAFSKLTGPLMNMQIYANYANEKKLMTYIFSERRKIDKA